MKIYAKDFLMEEPPGSFELRLGWTPTRIAKRLKKGGIDTNKPFSKGVDVFKGIYWEQDNSFEKGKECTSQEDQR